MDSADVRVAQPGASASVQAVWCLYTAAPGTAWHRLVTTQPAAGGKSRVLKCAHFIKPGPGRGFHKGVFIGACVHGSGEVCEVLSVL